MKLLTRWLKDIFSPELDLDVEAIRSALNDSSVRTLWVSMCLSEIKQITLEVDKRLLTGSSQFTDLCARRQAYQDMLVKVLSARKVVLGTQDARPNPPSKVPVNLDRVTS